MNILHHKSWHVRTKENIARVKRDEAKAAEEEKNKLERVRLAEHEDRMNRLKRKAGGNIEDPFANPQQPSTSNEKSTSGGHVNFFEDLEAQERTNLASGGNKEYQKDKRKEHQEWESKMGIMKRFAEDTKELKGESSWWESIDRTKNVSTLDETKEKPVKKKSEKELRKELKRQIKEEKKRKKAKKRSRHYSSSSDSDSGSKEEAKRQKLELLRKERLERELAEQRRVKQLLGEAPASKPKESKAERPKYSNQFNPNFVRR